MDLKKKIGPLPLGAWIAIVGGAIVVFLFIKHQQNSSTSSTSSTSNTVDPNNPLGLTYAEESADEAAGIDPNTGVPYATENNSNLDNTGGGGGGTGSTGDTGSGYLTDQSVTADFEQALADSGFTPNGTPPPTFQQEVNDVTGTLNALGLNLAITPTSSAATGSGSGSGSSSGSKTLPSLAKGGIRAPSSHSKPTAPTGYHTVGQGNGYWEFVPNKVTTSSNKPPSNTKPPKTLTANQEANRRNS